MKHPFVNLLVRWVVLALGVALAAEFVTGIKYDTAGTLFTVVVLLSFFNAILRPILLLFTLPFIVLTLGVGVLVINAVLFLLVGRLVDGFVVTGFWPAFWGSVIVSLTNVVMTQLLRDKGRGPRPPPARRPPGGGGDIIDI
jgi:putative membrane protein